jgi:hypothetical protein
MSPDEAVPPTPENPGDERGPKAGGPEGAAGSGGGDQAQPIHHSQVGARVPEGIGRGTYATGMVVMTGQAEFVLDFLLRLSRPHSLAARVVAPVPVMPGFIAALQDNLGKYTARFGPPPVVPKDPAAPRPSIQDIYDDLKISDDMLSGVYTNGLLIGHTPAEFCLDFLTNFYPLSAVSCRVFIAAPNLPQMIESLRSAYEQYRRRLDNPPPPPPPPPTVV